MSNEARSEPARSKKKKKKRRPEERSVTTTHRASVGGSEIEYTATAGTLHLRGASGEPRASVFYTAYMRASEEPSRRPITFAFNGGPGSSSVWLHLGILGPRRVAIPDVVAPPAAPYQLVDNESSILDASDLVFIDPVGTGYSRALGETEAKSFHGVEEDVESVGEFIERFLTRHGRWNSPRFIAGESYGTTRAAGLALHLNRRGIATNGLVLVSAALMFQTLIFEAGNDLPHVLALPTYALAAAYHGKVEPRSTSEVMERAERFAIETYAPALLLGASLDEARRESVAAELEELTGLAAEQWLRHDLRMTLSRFCRALLEASGEVVGRLDSRFRGLLAADADDPASEDPSLYFPLGPYAALLNDYLHRELAYREEERYETVSWNVIENWKWSDEKRERFGFLNRNQDLRRAMIQNPAMKVLFMSGIYDLATPYFASKHTARHLGREATIQSNVREAFYESGHMMYFHAPSRAKMRSDLLSFVGESVPGRGPDATE